MQPSRTPSVALIVAGPPSLWLGRVLPLLLAASAAIVAWALLATSYRLQDGDLVIRSGPLRWRLPVASIASVASTHSIIAAPALSSERLELRCKDPERTVQISPRDPAAFVAALTGVNATITVIRTVPSGV